MNQARRLPQWLRVTRWLTLHFIALVLAGCATGTGTDGIGKDPLPSWSNSANKYAIFRLVADVQKEGSPSWVPPAERVAVFDNDGTLWTEYPQYTQLVFMLDQVAAAAPQHPEWKDNAAFKAIAAKDEAALRAAGEKALIDLLVQANAGMDSEVYDKTIREWLATARHPTFSRPYTELVYQPQLELLKFLRANGFRTYIVSGGGIEFMRPWTEEVYGIPPEQVVGSTQGMRFETKEMQAELVREPRMAFFNDGPAKPVAIYTHIGRRPILAFGNSDGDLPMLQYTMAGGGPRLALILHHDDAEREAAYDRESRVGKLDKALDEATARGWNVVSMKNDWKKVFLDPLEKR